MSPPARERRPMGTGGASKSYLAAGPSHRTRFAKSDGPLGEYLAGRERVLGIDAKIARLLESGAVAILHRDEHAVHAVVDGDHGRYFVECDEVGWWSCSCPGWGAKCSHVGAVKRVVGIGAAQ
jgi:hypothetical protein